MRVFLTRQIDNNEELRTQLVQVESELAVFRITAADAKKLLKELQEEVQAAKVEAFRIGEKKQTIEAKCNDAKQEEDQLNKELEDLWAVFEAQKK